MARCTSSCDRDNGKRVEVMADDAPILLDPATEYQDNRLIATRGNTGEER